MSCRKQGFAACALFAALLAAAAGLSACRKKAEPAHAPAPPAPIATPRLTPAPTPAPIVAPTPEPTPAQKAAVGKAIEAEDYDVGGEGVGYHDTTPGNSGKAHRQEDVDIQDINGHGCAVSSIEPGEWLAYTLNFPKAGNYDVDLSASNWLRGKRSIHLTLDDKPLGPALSLARSAAEFEMTASTIEGVALPAGVHKLKIHSDSAEWNFDSFEIVPLLEDWITSATPKIAVQTQWDRDLSPAAGAEITLQGRLEDGRRWRSNAVTDAKGNASLPAFSIETAEFLSGSHKDAKLGVQKKLIPADAQPIHLLFAKATGVFGRVVMKDGGAAVSGAEVRILGTEFHTLTDAGGAWQLPNVNGGSVQIVAVKDLLCSFSSRQEVAAIPIFLQEMNGPYVLTLREGAMFAGRVVDEANDLPITSATLTVRASTGESGAYLPAGELYGAITDKLGRFNIAGVYGADVETSIEAPDYVPLKDTFHFGENCKADRVFRLERGATVTASVFDSSGKAVADALVQQQIGQGAWLGDARTGADGKAVVRNVSRKGPAFFSASKDDIRGPWKKADWSKDDASRGEVALLMPQRRDLPAQRTGRIIGTVSDAKGVPVRGVSVAWMGLLQNSPAMTGKDGRYELTVKSYSRSRGLLTASPPPPYAFSSRNRVVPGDEENPREENFTLEEGGWLGVTTVDESDKPLEGIRVRASFAQSPATGGPYYPRENSQLVTGSDGKVRFEQLPNLPVFVYAEGEGFTPASQAGAAVNQEVKLTLAPAAVILGRVIRDEDGEPIKDFTVRVVMDAAIISPPDADAPRQYADEGGQFCLGDLRMGENYTLRVAAQGRDESKSEIFTASRRDSAREHVFRLTKAPQITVAVADGESRAPLVGAEVFFGRTAGPRNDFWKYIEEEQTQAFEKLETARTGSDGTAVFMDNAPKSTILVRMNGYHRVKIEPDERGQYAASESVCFVPLSKAIEVKGVFTSPDGSPQPRQMVHLQCGTDLKSIVSDAMGAYDFPEAESGQCDMTAYWRTSAGATSGFIKRSQIGADPVQTINLGDAMGDSTINGAVTIDGKAPEGSGWLFLANQFGWEYTSLSTTIMADGTYRFEGLKPGAYSITLSLRPPGGAERQVMKTIEIQGSATRNIDFSSPHKITARLVFPNGMDAETRARYTTDGFSYDPFDSPVPDEQNLDKLIRLKQHDDRIEATASAVGPYRLYLYFKMDDGSKTNVLLPGDYMLNTLQGDQDLGDIQVPAMGGVRFKLAYAHPQDRSLYFTMRAYSKRVGAGGDGGVMDEIYIDLPKDDGESNTYAKMRGDYVLELIGGAYNGPRSYRLTLPGRYHVDDPQTMADWGTIIVYPVYHVRGRLVFSGPGLAAGLTQMRLLSLTGQSDRADGVAGEGACSIGKNGTFDLPGLFMGSYSVTLSDDRGRNSRKLPNVLNLNDSEADQDMGDLPIESHAPASH